LGVIAEPTETVPPEALLTLNLKEDSKEAIEAVYLTPT